jgi:Domain of unknown function (DUF4105)
LIFGGGPATAADPLPYLEELIDRARAERLAERREWLNLGHCRPDLLGPGWTSLIDSPDFFAAENGKMDPDAELEATLAAFFAPPSAGPPKPHPQCTFVARYRWLKAELNLDPERLSEQRCPEFEAWLATIDAERVTLIFPAAYMNNPSSMFGHTLLRFDRAGQDERTRLLSYAVNYGATVEDDNGLLFAIYGLTGGYRGTYSVMPYHQLVRQYSDYENRDIWEYQLNLSAVEVQRLLEHLWELQGNYADYYFLDENCSYQLLFLLDVARPGLALTDRFEVYAVPVDTVRATADQHGLLRGTVFRPSSRTRIEHRLRTLSRPERELVYQLAGAELPPDATELQEMTAPRRAAVLELAADFVTYRLRTGEQPRDQAAALAWRLLAARSRIAAAASVPSAPEPAVRPDQGHASARAALGIGARDGRLFQAVRARPAYHRLADPGAGYLRGAEIDFLDLELRRYAEDQAPILDSLTVVGIRSLSPRNELFKPVSWRLGGGLERFRADGNDEKGELVAALWAGAGPSEDLGQGALGSLMLQAELGVGTDCPDTCFAAAGPAFTLVWPATERWTFLLDASLQLLISDHFDGGFDVGLSQSYALGRNFALELDLAVEDDGAGAQAEWSTSLLWYF